MHGDQRRASFVLHPLEVASLLNGRRFDDEVIAAGALHDVVEKTDASLEDVAERFGPRVASIVAAVSESRTTRSARPRCGLRRVPEGPRRVRSSPPTRSLRRASCAPARRTIRRCYTRASPSSSSHTTRRASRRSRPAAKSRR
jgi:hypothetical protein